MPWLYTYTYSAEMLNHELSYSIEFNAHQIIQDTFIDYILHSHCPFHAQALYGLSVLCAFYNWMSGYHHINRVWGYTWNGGK